MDGVVRGLVKVVGNMVGTGRGKGVHWSSKAVRAMLEATEGRINILKDYHIIGKMNYVTTSWFFVFFVFPNVEGLKRCWSKVL